MNLLCLAILMMISIYSPQQEMIAYKFKTPEEAPCDSYRNPVWSPDGNFIAFTAVCAGKRDILITEIGSGSIRNLTNTPNAAELNPVWSPDSTQIAYDSRELLKGTDIWIVSILEAEAHNLTAELDLGDRFSNTLPTWSPDGEYIAFMSENSVQSDIVVVHLSTLQVINFTSNLNGLFYQPIWSMDGEHLAFTSLDAQNPGLWIVSFETAQVKQLTALAVDMFTWSSRDNTVTACVRGVDDPIKVIALDGTISISENIVFGSDAPHGIANPIWSNTGRFIAIEGIDSRIDIWIADSELITINNITNLPDSNELSPSWSPDDTQIAFASDREGDWNIWIMNSDGSNPVNLTGKHE